ncbi:aminoacyl-tRNA hydrolase [bacterium]|nr:aminoacyl-tRNA hydrolase [bacterium]MBU1072721.1 aminoacyl-tRNA hydrolase [bacterium]MBU1676115.1 aminoacyl-tRNA hydrolase [bacterium]
MWILVGLGNPGPQYERTRHNLGFRTLDTLAARHGLAFGRLADACIAATGRIAGAEVTLLKPMLYMNRCGEAWARWTGSREIDPAQGESEGGGKPLVVCDDIALPLGTSRLRSRGGAGGHRGLESMLMVLGDGAFPRLRLGVAGGEGSIPPESWPDYVLSEFSTSEWPLTEDLIDHACATLECVLLHGVEAAASRYNSKPPAL